MIKKYKEYNSYSSHIKSYELFEGKEEMVDDIMDAPNTISGRISKFFAPKWYRKHITKRIEKMFFDYYDADGNKIPEETLSDPNSIGMEVYNNKGKKHKIVDIDYDGVPLFDEDDEQETNEGYKELEKYGDREFKYGDIVKIKSPKIIRGSYTHIPQHFQRGHLTGRIVAKSENGQYLVEFDGISNVLHDGNSIFDIWSQETIGTGRKGNKYWFWPHELILIKESQPDDDSQFEEDFEE